MAPAVGLKALLDKAGEVHTWGPPTTTETTLEGAPYAHFSKGDKLGRMADWTGDSKDRSGGRQYNRNYRDQQVYGAGTSSIFAVQQIEDESTFSVVDNTRQIAKSRGFGRGGALGRGGRGQRGQQQTRGGRGNLTNTTVAGRQGQQGQYDNRGGRGGRGGRRFGGWRDFDKPQRNRDASVAIKSDWKMLEEIEFSRLSKLNLETDDGEDIDSYGFLYYYDRSYDKQPVKAAERKLNIVERAAYNVSASADPVIQDLAEKGEATIFATDTVLSALMCAPRSVYSWDIVIIRQGNKVYLDKRDDSNIDMVTVNENAADAPLESSEGNKDPLNNPNALALEAGFINHSFANQTVSESETSRVEMENANPFSNPAEETDPLASKAYKYRRFDLSLNDEEPINLIVRTEVDAAMRNNVTGEDIFITLKALNEFDHKSQGSGGALDWRTKLASQRGAVIATEMKNNSYKLARWTCQATLARADMMKLGFVSRANPKANDKHVILGVFGYKPREFAAQMNLSLSNGWGIVRTIADMCLKMSEGKYVLIKDPNKPVLRLYEVPMNTFDEDEDDRPPPTTQEEDE